MGNTLRCPKGFSAQGVQGCFVTCPLDQGFVQVAKDGGTLSCGFRDKKGLDETSLIPLQQVPFLPPPPADQAATAPVAPTLDEVKQLYPELFEMYLAEQRRFDQELKVTIERIGKDRALQLAFQKLQDAENARDIAPEAYIAAKKAYYQLTKGDAWEDEERRRVENAEIVPAIQKVLDEYSDAQSRVKQSSMLSEVMSAVKDRTLTTEKEFGVGIAMLSKQLQNVRDQLNLERRKTEEKPKVIIPFLGYILNIVLGIAILLSIIRVIKAIQKWNAAEQGPVPFSKFGLVRT